MDTTIVELADDVYYSMDPSELFASSGCADIILI